MWRRGVNQSAGDVILSWIGPLHFGTFGGPGSAGVAVKTLWLLLGLAPALLAISGFLMYWNRYLSKKWPKRQPQVPATVFSSAPRDLQNTYSSE